MSVANDILNGQHDADLDSIIAAINGRRQALSRLKAASFRPGMLVRFNDRTRPAYLRGQMGRVSRVQRQRIYVKLNDPVTGFTEPRCPADIIDIVPEGTGADLTYND